MFLLDKRGLGPWRQRVAKLGLLRKQGARVSKRGHLAASAAWEDNGVTRGGAYVVWEGIVLCVIGSGVGRNRLVSQSPGEKSPTEERTSEGLGPDARDFPSSTKVNPLES